MARTEADKTQCHDATSERPEKEKENDILCFVSHLSAETEQEQQQCMKRMCFAVFDKDELINCSRTGKKRYTHHRKRDLL